MAERYGRHTTGSRAIYPTRFLPYIGVIVVMKLLRSFGLFLTFDLLKTFHIVQFLCLTKIGSALFFIFLQKPFSSGKKLTKHQWFRVGRHALFGSLIQLQWLFGLTLCGPLRTLFIYDHSHLAVITGLGALFSGTGGPSKFRGAVFFLIGIMALMLFDHDDIHTVHDENHKHSGIFSHILEHMTSITGWSDHKGGVMLLLLGLCFNCGYTSVAKKLSVDIGGAKRLNALSTLCSAVILLPWAAVVSLTMEMPDSVLEASSYFSLTVIVPLVVVILLVFVMDFYVEAVCIQRMELFRTACYGTMATLTSALFISWFWAHPFMSQLAEITREEHMLSGGVIFSYVLFMFATHILTSPTVSTRGSLVGHTASGKTIYNFTEEAIHQASHSIFLTLKGGLRQILEESDSRKIFYFLCVNLAFTFVEFIYGAWTNSLGLISDGFHMLFDCSALVMGLYAAVMTRWKATRMFSYGYDRVEILSGFVNGLFLIVIAFFVFTAALGRIIDPPPISTEKLLVVSVAGLLVNLVGIFAFSHGHTHGGGAKHGHSHGGGASQGTGTGHSHHGHSHGSHGYDAHGYSGRSHAQPPAHSHAHSHNLSHNTNMQGVYLHVLADTLGSVSVIISTLLIENYDLKIADPLCSLFISILIFTSVLPLVKETSLILLLQTPEEMQEDLASALNKILSIDGVLSYRDVHFWRHSSNVICGTIHVQMKQTASEQQTVSQVTSILKEAGVQNLTVQIEKESFFQHMTGLGASMNQVYEMTSNLRTLNYDIATDFIKTI